MKTKYTKKQIQESIKHWQKVLENLNEATTSSKYLYVTKANPSLASNARKAGASGLKKLEDPNQFETLENKLARYSTCLPKDFEKAYQISIPPAQIENIGQYEQELFDAIVAGGGKRIGDKELFVIDDAKLDEVMQKFIESHVGFSLV